MNLVRLDNNIFANSEEVSSVTMLPTERQIHLSMKNGDILVVGPKHAEHIHDTFSRVVLDLQIGDLI